MKMGVDSGLTCNEVNATGREQDFLHAPFVPSQSHALQAPSLFQGGRARLQAF